MNCPECGYERLEFKTPETREPHGEITREMYYECPSCKEKFTTEELRESQTGGRV